jgi:hypothetical protein
MAHSSLWERPRLHAWHVSCRSSCTRFPTNITAFKGASACVRARVLGRVDTMKSWTRVGRHGMSSSLGTFMWHASNWHGLCRRSDGLTAQPHAVAHSTQRRVPADQHRKGHNSRDPVYWFLTDSCRSARCNHCVFPRGCSSATNKCLPAVPLIC